VDASRWWAIAGLVLGVSRAVCNARAGAQVLVTDIDTGGSLKLTPEAARSARLWNRVGWAFVGTAFICAAVAELVG
jgi:hypothetical protein